MYALKSSNTYWISKWYNLWKYRTYSCECRTYSL